MYEKFPNDENDKNELPDSVSIYEYLSIFEEDINDSENKIAVVNVEGALRLVKCNTALLGQIPL
ncbi:MAG: hypothetical protein CM15mP126_1210 [Gammaproteobacteria bacterium]|nr:MAG: hypothetical protein CM15mP126_1210 [Gammaproteobacteria bacterium]